MTRALSKSIIENERIRLTPDYAYVQLMPSLNDLLLGKFYEKITNDPTWLPLLSWMYIVENGKQYYGREPTVSEIVKATNRPPKIGNCMTEWFKSLLPPYLVMTNTLTDHEGWILFSQLMKYKEKVGEVTLAKIPAIYGVPIMVALRRPLNEEELLNKIYDERGLGITSHKNIEHLMVLLNSSGVPYEFDIDIIESPPFLNEVDFEIAGLLRFR